MWHHHLFDRIFLLMSDNISLKYLFDQQNLNVRQTRWLSILSEYDFEIKHIKGKENKVVVALSCHANLLFASSSYKSDLENQILKVENKFEDRVKMDKNYQNLREKVTEKESENVKTNFSLNEKGSMLYKNRLYVPNIPEIKLLILNEVHKSIYSGHPGYQNMIMMLRKYYF